jgi:hypothetical protein
LLAVTIPTKLIYELISHEFWTTSSRTPNFQVVLPDSPQAQSRMFLKEIINHKLKRELYQCELNLK